MPELDGLDGGPVPELVALVNLDGGRVYLAALDGLDGLAGGRVPELDGLDARRVPGLVNLDGGPVPELDDLDARRVPELVNLDGLDGGGRTLNSATPESLT